MITRWYRNTRHAIRKIWYALQAETKVLSALPSEPADGFYIDQVATVTGLDPFKVTTLLSLLCERGLVASTRALTDLSPYPLYTRRIFYVTARGIDVLIDRCVE